MHAFSAKMVVPREAGLLHFGVRSTYILGLQIGSILSRFYRAVVPNLRERRRDRKSETRLSFFVAANVRQRLVL